MKTLKYAAVAVILSFFAAMPAFAQFIKAELQVSGLTCSMCQLSTQKALKTLPFISDIKPDLKRNLFLLTFKSGEPADMDQIRKKVQGAGFSVNRLVATFKFSNVAVKQDFHYKYGETLYHFMDVSEKTLNGEVPLNVISNGFIPAAEYKKYAGKTTYTCYKSGVMGKEKVVHVTI